MNHPHSRNCVAKMHELLNGFLLTWLLALAGDRRKDAHKTGVIKGAIDD
jgi:hypothetical protein